jgi:hypothetical protein
LYTGIEIPTYITVMYYLHRERERERERHAEGSDHCGQERLADENRPLCRKVEENHSWWFPGLEAGNRKNPMGMEGGREGKIRA